MFQNSFQPPYFEIFNSKQAKNCNGNKEKHSFIQKLIDLKHSQFIFDPLLKTYTLQANQIKLPSVSSTDLSLVHPFFAIQAKFEDIIHLELLIVDTKGVRRRIMLNSTKKSEIKPFFISMSLSQVYNCYVTLIVDLCHFTNQYKNSTYRSLEQISISSPCQIKRMFMLQSLDMHLLEQIQFPIGIENKIFHISFQKELELQNSITDDTNKETKQDKENNEYIKVIHQQQNQFKIKQVQKQDQLKKQQQLQKINQPLQEQPKQPIIYDNREQDLQYIEDIIEQIENSPTKLDNVPSQVENEFLNYENIDDLINALNAKPKKIQELEIQHPIIQETKKQSIPLKNPIGCTTITKQGQETIVIEARREQGNFSRMIFDPVLNCYFDPVSNKCFI